MATLDRADEVERFMLSLIAQTYTDFEVLVIDQNRDNRVQDICHKYRDTINIIHIRSEQKGLSVNRNIGLERCGGGIIGFPDDDCEYAEDTLEKAAAFFNASPGYCFYTCGTRDKNSGGSILRAKSADADISIFNFTSIGISFTIFVRARALGSFRFDEQLGVGAAFGSGEESDMLLFLLRGKNRGRYHAGHCVFHPAKAETPAKALVYGRGFGALYKKAVVKYGFFILFPVYMLRMIKGIFNVIFSGDRETRTASLRGRAAGFIQYQAR
jgi:glycosyltransferase involved in cell wall biosynthesis